VIGADADDRGSSLSRASGADLLAERELWRVEAGRGPGRPVGVAEGATDGIIDGATDGIIDGIIDGGGVFDLAFDWSDGRWALVGCAD
jgi:hypothetical protein